MTTPRLHLVAGYGGDHRPDIHPFWDVPVPLTGPAAPPPFPIDVYPGWAADMVIRLAHFTQTDPAMAGALVLAVLSACAAGRLEVEAKPGWREPVNLFISIIAEPGERKTPVHSAVTRPLHTAQAVLAERVAPFIEEHAARKDIAARTAEQAKATAARADANKRDELMAEAIAAAQNAEAITVPTLPRLIADDATPEKLAGLMAANGGRMAIISDEGGIFDTLAGRYSGTPNLDPYLKGHAGQPMLIDRQGRDSEYVPKPALTVGVVAQPSVLRKFGSNTDLAGRGLVARFLFVLPVSLTGYRDVDPDPIPEPIAATYQRHVHDLAATLAEWTDPAVVTLTPEARLLRNTAAAEIEIQLRPGGALHHMREWANKLSGTTLRLAGLLHVAHHPTDAWRLPIDSARMAEAVKLAAFFIAHYRAALHAIVTDAQTEAARHVLGVLVAKGMLTFTRRELHRKVIRQLPKADQVAAVLNDLAQLGWVRVVDSGYELHPLAGEYLGSVDTLTPARPVGVLADQPSNQSVNTTVDTPLTGVDTAPTGLGEVSTGVNALSTPTLTPETAP